MPCIRAILAVVVLLLAGCGGGAGRTVDASTSALRDAGWQAKSVRGMPKTASGVPQVGYLELLAPDGTAVDVQFLKSDADAGRELAAAEKQLRGFSATAIANTIAFSHPAGRTPVPDGTLDELRALLRG